MKFTTTCVLIGGAIALAIGAIVKTQESTVPDTMTLQKMAARFAPTDIGADLSKLSAADRKVLAKLVDASKVIDALFLRQAWAGNEQRATTNELNYTHGPETCSGRHPARRRARRD